MYFYCSSFGGGGDGGQHSSEEKAYLRRWESVSFIYEGLKVCLVTAQDYTSQANKRIHFSVSSGQIFYILNVLR